MKNSGPTTVNSTFLSPGFDFKKNWSMKSLLSLRPLKQKKNIGYNSRFEGVIPIFLIPNHVLRKTQKKF
jgi:hypothetical protein